MENDTANRLLARIKSFRLALGLSQELFAEKVGLGYKYYQSVEAGRRRDLRLSTLEKLAEGCGLRLHELLNFDLDPMLSVQGSESSATKSASHKAPRPGKKPAKAKGA